MLKDRMVLKGGQGRNKMLIKGGSNFNTLVRTLKQDVIDLQLVKHPQPKLISKPQIQAKKTSVDYDVGQLSLDQVHVFPDGDINIQGKKKPPGAYSFSAKDYMNSMQGN